MNLKLGLIVFLLVAAVLGGLGLMVNKTINKPVLTPVTIVAKPWIEVVAPGVFELAEDQEMERRELFTGDELQNGAVIGIREDALANIHFPDGSVARLDSGTKLVLEAGDFEEKTNKLNVRINLLWGRVWSKVIAVLTPESAWEVKTTNAIAAVRGTAFGVEYVEEGKSNIVGYENKVEVKLVDPETKKVIPTIAMVVEAKKILEVRKEAVEALKTQLAAGELRQGVAAIATKANKPIMEVKEASEKVLNQDWIKRSIEADKKLNQKTKAAAAEEKKTADLKTDLEIKVSETRQEPSAEGGSFSGGKENLEKAAEELKTSGVQTAIPPAPALIVRNLIIKPSRDLNFIVEGDSVIFRSFAQYADGSGKEVTLESNWKVLGEIGFMKSPGSFVAKLSDSVSELGASSGSVIALWKDPKTGAVFEAGSPIFKVELGVDLNFDPTRG